MTTLRFIKSVDVLVDVGPDSLKAVYGEAGLEAPLERQADGQLTAACKEQVTLKLKGLIEKRRHLGRPRAFCALGTRGVSLRRLTVPAGSRENFHQLLELQIEREFPLPPGKLAWGYQRMEDNGHGPPGPESGRQLIVVAVKREVLEEYEALLHQCGLDAVFTLGAWAVGALCPPTRRCAVLEVGSTRSELVSFQNGVPTSLRSLPWGHDDVLRPREAPDLSAHGAWAAALHGLLPDRRLYLTGPASRLDDVAARLAQALGDRVDCQRVEVPAGEGRSAAILGLRRLTEKNGGGLPLLLEVHDAGLRPARTPAPAFWGWAALALILALGLFLLRYAEPLARKPGLATRLAAAKTARDTRPEIDRELSFLQHLETNQPPYLAVLSILAEAAARGTRVESISMNRQGDLSLRGTMPGSRQATDFRSKLIESGWFSTVVLDEQTPVENQQKVIVRISARWTTSHKPPPKPGAETAAAARVTPSQPVNE